MSHSLSKLELELIEDLLLVPYVDRVKMFVALDVLHKDCEKVDARTGCSLCYTVAQQSGQVEALAKALSVFTGKPITSYIACETDYEDTYTEVYKLESIQDVQKFCRLIQRAKSRASKSLTFTVVLTANRSCKVKLLSNSSNVFPLQDFVESTDSSDSEEQCYILSHNELEETNVTKETQISDITDPLQPVVKVPIGTIKGNRRVQRGGSFD